jgi:hypothetical protein
MAKLVLERAGKLLDEGVFYETQEIEKTFFEYQIGDKFSTSLIFTPFHFHLGQPIPL